MPLDGPELVVGLVGAAGTELKRVAQSLTTSLARITYSVKEIRLSQLLHGVPSPPWEQLPKGPEEARYNAHMDAGNQLRENLGTKDALALLAISAIREERFGITKDEQKPAPRTVYLLHSLKTPAEAKTLREIYGWRFVLIAAYCPRQQRVHNLACKIAESHHEFDHRQFLENAESILRRDESEKLANEFGQNVRDTFPCSDVFVNAHDSDELMQSVNRAVEIFFGHPFHTPTRDEYGMFHAQSDALRSASLGRQVGAVVTTTDGDIVATGTNEVPQAGGGLYWCDSKIDHRDHTLGYDPNDKLKRRLLADVLKRLKENDWLSKEKSDEQVEQLVEQAVAGKPHPLMKGSQLMNILEFGRPVHAEMAALMSAARRGISVSGCTLYSTTFPCHECARHVVAAGIRRVVYVEPYPKSLVPELYPDSISVDESPGLNRVGFEAFVGIAPKKYFESFTMPRRKNDDGTIVEWNPTTAHPRLMTESSTRTYIARETVATEKLMKLMTEKGLVGRK